MAYDRTGIWSVKGELSVGSFDVVNTAPARVRLILDGSPPPFIEANAESPESVQGQYRKPAVALRDVGEWGCSYRMRPIASGATFAQDNLILLPIFGTVTDEQSATSTVASGAGVDGCVLTADIFDATTSVGNGVAVTCDDGRIYLREIRTYNDGTKTITWHPSLPSGVLPDVGEVIAGCLTYHRTTSGTGAVTQTLELECQHEDTTQRFIYLGVGVEGALRLEPLSDMPFATWDLTMKVASCTRSSLAVVKLASDNGEPVTIAGDMKFGFSTYSGTTRQANYSSIAMESFNFDMGNNLAPAPDANAATNAIGRWKDTLAANTYQGNIMMVWSSGLHTLISAKTAYTLHAEWGGGAGTYVCALSIANAYFHKVEVTDSGGLELASVDFVAGDAVDRGGTNPPELSPVKLFIYEA